MNQLDIYYRALLNYRAVTTKNRDCTQLRRAFTQTDITSDHMTVTRTICTVEEDWLCEIEKGLSFIEKAIKEDRQFIYSNGEVEPIEKVKHISKDSVQHLAKHSNLITREQTGDDIIPDKLYSVERLNDYAVYENRFLYMLLCYLRDFVTIRYNKILDLSNKYDAVLTLDKQIVSSKQKIAYRVELHDERRDDKYLREHNVAKNAIDRMDLILKTILSFLATPLMDCAGKAAMLKPPITKTNVLKMDHNFKNAVALYDYIIAYDKDGYTVEHQTLSLTPFQENLADELSEAGCLMTFLTYEYGLGLNETLKKRYEAEERARKQQELDQKQKQLELIKHKVAKSELPPEEYILALEKQIKLLQNETSRLEPLHQEILRLEDQNQELVTRTEAMQQQIDTLNEEMHATEVRHAQQIEALKNECNERIYAMMVQHDNEKRALEQAYQERLNALNTTLRETIDNHRQQLSDRDEQIKAQQEKNAALLLQYTQLQEEKRLCEARLKAIRLTSGEDSMEDFTQKEAFNELEEEFRVFAQFYQQQWNKTKKTIRSKFFNLYYLRGQNGQDKQP